MLGHLMSCHFS